MPGTSLPSAPSRPFSSLFHPHPPSTLLLRPPQFSSALLPTPPFSSPLLSHLYRTPLLALASHFHAPALVVALQILIRHAVMTVEAFIKTDAAAGVDKSLRSWTVCEVIPRLGLGLDVYWVFGPCLTRSVSSVYSARYSAHAFVCATPLLTGCRLVLKIRPLPPSSSIGVLTLLIGRGPDRHRRGLDRHPACDVRARRRSLQRRGAH